MFTAKYNVYLLCVDKFTLLPRKVKHSSQSSVNLNNGRRLQGQVSFVSPCLSSACFFFLTISQSLP